MRDLFLYIGQRVKTFFRHTGNLSRFLLTCGKSLLLIRERGSRSLVRVVIRQIKFTGIQAIPFLSSLALIIGAIVIIQSFTQLSKVGAESVIGQILVLVIIRELGPLLAAIVVIARSGTAIAAELSTNKVMEEVDALEMMGVDPFRFIVIPRILGAIVSMFCLIIYFDVVALLGGYLVANLKTTILFDVFWTRIFQALEVKDLLISLSKSFVFGLIISLFCSYFGLAVKGATTEIPQAATKAVVLSILLVFVSDSVFSYIFYF